MGTNAVVCLTVACAGCSGFEASAKAGFGEGLVAEGLLLDHAIPPGGLTVGWVFGSEDRLGCQVIARAIRHAQARLEEDLRFTAVFVGRDPPAWVAAEFRTLRLSVTLLHIDSREFVRRFPTQPLPVAFLVKDGKPLLEADDGAEFAMLRDLLAAMNPTALEKDLTSQ